MNNFVYAKSKWEVKWVYIDMVRREEKKNSDRFKKVYWLVWLLRVVVLSYYGQSARGRGRG